MRGDYMPIVKGVNIQDLHFGHKDTERMYNELSIVREYLLNNEVHILNINGDYFDRKLTASEPATLYAVNFFSELVEICKEKNIRMRVLQGTRSHDLNQISTLFQHYLNDPDLDLRFIHTVEEEQLLGLDVLYIPEEYPEDSEEYYGEFKKREYSMINGHGTWDFVAFENQIEHGAQTNTLSAPIFMYSEWKDAVKNGFISFGHIHGRNQYGQKIFYSGSFTRWNYVEPSDKGFITWWYDTDKKTYKVEFVDNALAPSFEAISVKSIFEGKDLAKLSLEEVSLALNLAIERYDNVRIDLSGLSEEKIKILKKSLSDNPKVKTEVRQKKALLKESAEPAIYEKYSYILKRELPLNETVKKFVKEEFEQEITLDKINELLKAE
jgi:DNA repair exonuclease SbcCD nuclease subunit